MQIVLLIVSTISLVTPLWISWLSAFAVFAVASSFRIMADRQKIKRS